MTHFERVVPLCDTSCSTKVTGGEPGVVLETHLQGQELMEASRNGEEAARSKKGKRRSDKAPDVALSGGGVEQG